MFVEKRSKIDNGKEASDEFDYEKVPNELVTEALDQAVFGSGDASSEILVRLKGGTFFGVDFYCIFG